MYKSLPADIKTFKLNTDLFHLHKNSKAKSDFGMNNTAELLENGFGLYSTHDLKKPIGPVKTEYYRISITRQGTAEFHVGLNEYKTKPNKVLFGIPSQIFSLQNFSPDFLAYYMLFSEDFISDALSKLSKKFLFPFLNHTGIQCFELQEDTAAEIEKIIFKINDEVKKHLPTSAEMIRLYIQQILILSNRNYGSFVMENNVNANSLQNLFDTYLKLVSKHFLTIRKVSDYADMLHVSPDYLNRAIKSCSSKTAHEFINDMILLEAKALLQHTKLSVSEIAYKLEFADPSHFNRFFKKLSNQTPAEFRK